MNDRKSFEELETPWIVSVTIPSECDELEAEVFSSMSRWLCDLTDTSDARFSGRTIRIAIPVTLPMISASRVYAKCRRRLRDSGWAPGSTDSLQFTPRTSIPTWNFYKMIGRSNSSATKRGEDFAYLVVYCTKEPGGTRDPSYGLEGQHSRTRNS